MADATTSVNEENSQAVPSPGPARYRTRVSEIEAIRFDGESNCHAVHALIGVPHAGDCSTRLVYVNPCGAWQVAVVGDVIVRDAEGRVQVMDADVFADRYEPAECGDG